MNILKKVKNKSIRVTTGVALTALLLGQYVYGYNENYNQYLTDAEQQFCEGLTIHFDFPLIYNVDGDNLRLMSSGGTWINTAINPWGAHVPIYTGHVEGNGKSDWTSYATTDYAEMTVLGPGGANGKCGGPEETCGMHIDELLALNPPYVAPEDGFRVKSVVLEAINDPMSEATGGTKWRVDGNICNIAYSFMHVGQISDVVADQMVEKGYQDPRTATGDHIDINLIADPANPVVLADGDYIAFAEIFAKEIDGHPGYYETSLEHQLFPNSHLEFRAWDYRRPDLGSSFPMFLLLENDAILDKFKQFLVTPYPMFLFNDPDNELTWLWAAEAVPWTTESASNEDYSSIHSSLGGWFEKAMPAPCVELANDCDQLLSIFRIHKNSIFYDSNLYSSADSNYLLYYRHDNSEEPTFANGVYGELLSPLYPDPLKGNFRVKWGSPNAAKPLYQVIAYRVSPGQEIMRVFFGPLLSDKNAMVDIIVPNGTEVCDGVNVVCFNHMFPQAQE
ncbi:MAG: hypothetical protein ABUK01_05760 [Leptospirales bacterium]